MFNPTENPESEEDEDSSDEESTDEKKKHQKDIDQGEVTSNDFNAATCLYPKEPANDMIINHSPQQKNIKLKRKDQKNLCIRSWSRPNSN